MLAWPRVYFRNYIALLSELKIPSTEVQLPFFINSLPRKGVICHAMESTLKKDYARDFAKWNRLVALIRWVNLALTSQPHGPSFYAMSLLNPFNYIPMRFAVSVCGISKSFWEDVVVSIYSSSFLTTNIDWVPCVVVPSKTSI